jgi:hypothetical protein
MSFLNNLFGAAPKQRTMLDDVQEAGSKIIVDGYRKIAAKHGIAPTVKRRIRRLLRYTPRSAQHSTKLNNREANTFLLYI